MFINTEINVTEFTNSVYDNYVACINDYVCWITTHQSIRLVYKRIVNRFGHVIHIILYYIIIPIGCLSNNIIAMTKVMHVYNIILGCRYT